MSIVELGVAMAVLSVAVIGVMGSMGSGLSLVGESKQRSAGSAVAQERLERVHKVPYTRIALYEQPVHSGDTNNPDNAVTTDGKYQVDGSTQESLVVCTAITTCQDTDGSPLVGALKHVDDPVKLGATQFNVYQYVTWHIDPSVSSTQPAYKRVVVIVTWKFPVRSGLSHSVTASSFIGPGGVILAAASPTSSPTPTPTPSPSPTPSPTPTPTSTQGPACGVLAILSGTGATQGYTNSTNLQVQLSGTGNCTPASADLSNNGTTWAPAATIFPANVTWSIPSGDGTKTVYARFHDSSGNLSVVSGVIVLDQTKPPTITNLRTVTCTISGSNRIVSLTWDGNATTDTNFLGYRVYKSIELGAYAQLLTTGSQSANDTDSKSYSSVRYVVRAYDRAGNESLDSNALPFSKNNC